MVGRIVKPKPSMNFVMAYNEKKVLSGVASIVGYANLPDCDYETVTRTFRQMENNVGYPVKEMSFHVSINPSDEDSCSQEDILGLVSEMMARMGYARQPFVVYKHNDIDREHYHVISIRVDGNGKKISSWKDGEKMNRFLASVAGKYHFTLGRDRQPEIEEQQEESSCRPAKIKMTFFNPRKEKLAQMGTLFQGALRYDFNGFEQFAAILKDYGLKVELNATDRGGYLTFQPMDRAGRFVGPPVPESLLVGNLYEDFARASELNIKGHHNRHRERERMENLVRAAFDYSKSEAHFEALLRNKGICIHLSTTKTGEIFGITFVDHTTRTVFKASELHEAISVSMMQDAVSTGKWRMEDRGEKRRKTYVQRAGEASKRDVIAMRDRQAAMMAKVLRPEANDWAAYNGRGDNDNEPKEKPTTDGRIVDDIMGGMRIRLD